MNYNIARSMAQGDAWRAQRRAEMAALGAAIKEQFLRWQLTAAEANVANLMLKGISPKDIAIARERTESTIRQQTQSGRHKSGRSFAELTYDPDLSLGGLEIGAVVKAMRTISLLSKMALLQNSGGSTEKTWDLCVEYQLCHTSHVDLHYYDGAGVDGYFGVMFLFETNLLGRRSPQISGLPIKRPARCLDAGWCWRSMLLG